MINILQTIKKCKTLNLIDPIDLIEFDNGFSGGDTGGTGGSEGGFSGGTGGGSSGTTSSVILPSLTISPNTDQIIAVGTTLCFNASGSLSLPQQAEQLINFNALSSCASYSNGSWTKTCGVSPAYDVESLNTDLLYRLQPWHIVADNNSFNTPGAPTNDTDIIFGVKSTGGYYFYWRIFKYCNADPSDCESIWHGYIGMKTPTGVYTNLSGGHVERYQSFKLKSNGSILTWEFTTEGNWAYNYYIMPIPADTGDFQFFINALYLNNRLDNIRTYRGSYQGNVTEFNWTSSCPEALVINGSQACYTPIATGSCQVCVSTTGLDPLCVDVLSVPLYLQPKDIECNTCN